MTNQVVVYPSDLTPPPGDFHALVAEVLEGVGARWIDKADDGDLTLADGTEIGLFLDEEENVAAFVLDHPGEAAIDLIHTLAERAAAFVTVQQRACAVSSTGDVTTQYASLLINPDDLPSRRAFDDWMHQSIAAARPRPETQPPLRPQRSLLQRLSDTLFGKEM